MARPFCRDCADLAVDGVCPHDGLRCDDPGQGERVEPVYKTRDKRKTGEGAMKGWATRRQRQQDRRVALDRLIEVADSITSDLIVGERAAEPGKYVVGALTLVNWRDRITSALRILEQGHA